MTLTVLCPTYKRGPETLMAVQQSFLDTRGSRDTQLVFVTEPNDKTWLDGQKDYNALFRVLILDQPSGNMAAALNAAWPRYTGASVLGFIGDDHRFRSRGWDTEILDALKGGGIAYGDDLVQGENLPTQWFVSTPIVEALGWFALPQCRHFYLDNCWKCLGEDAGCLYYLPEVKIEHLHFSYGKSELDETYVHTMQVGTGDDVRFAEWYNSPQYEIDVARVKGALVGSGA